MAYDTKDLRSQLATSTRSLGANVAPQYFAFSTAASNDGRWIRSQSCIINYANPTAGAKLARTGQVDEYVVLVPHATTSVTLTTDTESTQTTGPALIVMPPGTSAVATSTGGEIIRIFTTQNTDLAAACENHDFFDEGDPNVAPFVAWPDPVGGHKIRVYDLNAEEKDPNRFGRIFRCSTIMVNYFFVDPGPRDSSKLSPHFHDDFEQLSLQLQGDYVHHIRTPWTVDSAAWRDDEHQALSSPAVTIIPPPSIHTSQGVGNHAHQLIDIFAPPRLDFSSKPGWIRNADDYPMPPA
jgi:hypothetical protein